MGGGSATHAVPVGSQSRVPKGMSPSMLLRLTGLRAILSRTTGDPRVVIALIDGPPKVDHPSLLKAAISPVKLTGRFADGTSRAHATFLASMLVGRGEVALGLCRSCKLVAIAAIDNPLLGGRISTPAIAERLAEAVWMALRRSADVILLPLDISPGADGAWQPLIRALADAERLGVRTIVPAGNESGPASAILAAPGVVPVIGGLGPAAPHRWGSAVGRAGICAPASDIPGADADGVYTIRSGSSFAAAFVVAAFALLRSLRPEVEREVLWWELINPSSPERNLGRVPALDAGRSLEHLETIHF